MAVKAAVVTLFHKRWNVRIIAALEQNRGARFVILKQKLGANADSLSRCLGHLADHGWIQRNPGYGHPLRPEYLLTDEGHIIAPHCSRLEKVVATLKVTDTVYRKWSVPLLVALESGVVRFGGLRDSLAISPRALTQSLELLLDSNLVTRQRIYGLTDTGLHIADIGKSLIQDAKTV